MPLKTIWNSIVDLFDGDQEAAAQAAPEIIEGRAAINENPMFERGRGPIAAPAPAPATPAAAPLTAGPVTPTMGDPGEGMPVEMAAPAAPLSPARAKDYVPAVAGRGLGGALSARPSELGNAYLQRLINQKKRDAEARQAAKPLWDEYNSLVAQGYDNGGFVDFAKQEALNYALPQSSFYGRLGQAALGASGLPFESGGKVPWWDIMGAVRNAQDQRQAQGALGARGMDPTQAQGAAQAVVPSEGAQSGRIAELNQFVSDALPHWNAPLRKGTPEEVAREFGTVAREAAKTNPRDVAAYKAGATSADNTQFDTTGRGDVLGGLSDEAFLAGQQARIDAAQAGANESLWWNPYTWKSNGGHIAGNVPGYTPGPLGMKDMVQMGKGSDVSKVKYKKQGGEVTDEVEISYHNPYSAAGKDK